jgi:hypothetical protein
MGPQKIWLGEVDCSLFTSYSFGVIIIIIIIIIIIVVIASVALIILKVFPK